PEADRPPPQHPGLTRGDEAEGIPVQEDRAGRDHDGWDDRQRPARPEGDPGNLEVAGNGYGSIAGFPRRKNSRTVTVSSRVAHAEIPNTIQITAPNPGLSFTKFPPVVCVKRRIIIVGRHDPGSPPREGPAFGHGHHTIFRPGVQVNLLGSYFFLFPGHSYRAPL